MNRSAHVHACTCGNPEGLRCLPYVCERPAGPVASCVACRPSKGLAEQLTPRDVYGRTLPAYGPKLPPAAGNYFDGAGCE